MARSLKTAFRRHLFFYVSNVVMASNFSVESEATIDDGAIVIQTEGSIRRASEKTFQTTSRELDRIGSTLNLFHLTRARLNFAKAATTSSTSERVDFKELLQRYSYNSLMTTLQMSFFSFARESACLKNVLSLTYRQHHPSVHLPESMLSLKGQALELKKDLGKVVGMAYKLNELSQGMEELWSTLTEVKTTQMHTHADLITRIMNQFQHKANRSQEAREALNQKAANKRRKLIYRIRFQSEMLKSFITYIRPPKMDTELVNILERAEKAILATKSN